MKHHGRHVRYTEALNFGKTAWLIFMKLVLTAEDMTGKNPLKTGVDAEKGTHFI